MSQFARLQEDWVDHTLRIKRIQADGDWVLTETVWKTRGAASGVPLETEMAAAYLITDGNVSEVRFFWRWADAVESIGPSQ